MTPNATASLAALRDTAHFSWLIVPIAVFVLYLYVAEWTAGRRAVVAGGLAFLLADTFNELWNSAVFHLSGHAPVWGVAGKSSFQILIGWNIEIVLMFAVLGLASARLMPARGAGRIAGIPLWLWGAGVSAVLAVLVEIVLNLAGVLTWDWPWWSARFPLIVWLIGYLPFFVICVLVRDLRTDRQRVLALAAMLLFNGLFALVLALLGWL